jgi:hypothetical protein
MYVRVGAKTKKNTLFIHVSDGVQAIKLPDDSWLIADEICNVWLCTPIKRIYHNGEDIVSIMHRVGVLPKKYAKDKSSDEVPMNTEVLRHMLHHCVPYKDLAPLIATTRSEEVRHLAAEQLSRRRPRGSTVNPST